MKHRRSALLALTLVVALSGLVGAQQLRTFAPEIALSPPSFASNNQAGEAATRPLQRQPDETTAIDADRYVLVSNQFVFAIPDGWYVHDQNAAIGRPGPYGVVILSEVNLRRLSSAMPGSDLAARVADVSAGVGSGSVPSFLVDRQAARTGMTCDGFSDDERQNLLRDFTALAGAAPREPPDVETVRVGGCEGLRFRVRYGGSSGSNWTFLAYAVSDGNVLYDFFVRNEDQYFDNNLPPLEKAVSTLVFMSDGREEVEPLFAHPTPPPSGYSWRAATEPLSRVLVPNGWHYRVEVNPGSAEAYFISKEPIPEDAEPGQANFQTGISLHVARGIRQSTRVSPRDYVAGLRDSLGSPGSPMEVLRLDDLNVGRLAGFEAQTVGGSGSPVLRMHSMFLADEAENTAYIAMFETPAEQWAAEWPVAETVFKYLLSELDDRGR